MLRVLLFLSSVLIGLVVSNPMTMGIDNGGNDFQNMFGGFGAMMDNMGGFFQGVFKNAQDQMNRFVSAMNTQNTNMNNKIEDAFGKPIEELDPNFSGEKDIIGEDGMKTHIKIHKSTDKDSQFQSVMVSSFTTKDNKEKEEQKEEKKD